MSVKTFDFLKIQNSKLLVCEIRPVKCSVNTNAGRLKTTKWMNFQHWKELRFLLKTIAEDYEKARNNLKIAEDIKHGKPQNKISDSIKIAYMWALNKECCKHFLSPRKDACWSDTEDDPISLNDKGGRYKSWQPCGDMLVVSVALLDETEIQHNQKSSKNLYDTKNHRATSECISSSQYLDRSLIMALDPTLVSETPSISEYFTTQTSDTKLSNSDLDESRNIKPRILKSMSRASENTNKSPMQQHNLSMEDIQTTRKKHERSYFDTDSSESTELQLKSLSTSSDSQAEAAASKILLKASTLSNEYDNLITYNDDKKETITGINDITLKRKKMNRVDSPPNNSTNDYSHKRTKCSFSVPLVEMDQQNLKSYIVENIKLENSDSPDETNENNINKGFKFSFSSRLTPRISSPVDENCIESPEPHLKVGTSPTSTKMTIDNSLELHPELNTSNNLEVFSFDSDTQSKIVQNDSKSDLVGKNIKNQECYTEIAKNKEKKIQKYKGLKSFREISKNGITMKERITKKCSEINLQMETKNLNQEIQNKIPTQDLDQNYAIVEYDDQVEKPCIKDKSPHSLKPHEYRKTKSIRNLNYYKRKLKNKEIFHIENESNSGNEFSYLIPHTTEEITDNQLHHFQTEKSVLTEDYAIETSELPVSVMTSSVIVPRMNKQLEQPGDMYHSVNAHDVNRDKCSSPTKESEKNKIDNEIKGKESTKNYCNIRTRSRSIDVSQMAIASPDLFDDNYNTSEDVDTELSRSSKLEVEINEVSKTVEEIFKDLIPQNTDTSNIAVQYTPTANDCLAASEMKSVSEADNVDINNDFSRMPEKVSSATCKSSNLEHSPILGNRTLQIKTKNHLNSSLQSGPKRRKKKRRICNIKNKDSKNEDSIASSKCLRKDFKGLDKIQESENDMKEDIDDIFEVSNLSKNCIKNRKTLDEIMKKNDRAELKKRNEEVLEINPIEISEPNPLHMKMSQYNSTDDNDSNDDDLDLPDLGHAQDYEVSGSTAENFDDVLGVTIKHVLIKETEKSKITIESVTDILSSPTKRYKSSEYYKINKYIPAKSGRESDVPYCPKPKSLCVNEEKISNIKEVCVSNVEETNSSSLEYTLEENSISSCTESAESPDTRRSQRIKSIKGHHKIKSCCIGCENMDDNFPCKDKKVSKTKTKSKTKEIEQSIEYPYITQRKLKSSSNIGDTGKNKKNIKKRDANLKRTDKFTLDHSSETTSEEDLNESSENNNENNNANSILADELFKMSCKQKNDSLNISSTGTENNILQKLDDTQALLEGVSLDDLECDEVQPMDKTKKAMAEFDKMYKNFKSRRKKQGPDITLFMDSCKVTKKATQIKSTRKKSNVNRKFKITNLPDNQPKLNCWLTKSNKKSNPSLHVEALKASGSKDFENVLCENDSILYKQSLSKCKKKGEKRKKNITNSRSIKKHRLSEFSSEQTSEVHAADEGKDVQENKSSLIQDDRENGPLEKKSIELDENSSSTSVAPVEDNITSTCDISDQLDSSVLITHEERRPTEAEKASLIARNLEVINNEQLETLVIQHLPYLKKIAKGEELNERHTIYMKGGAAARSNTPEVIFAPFTDEQLEHVHKVLRNHLLQKLAKNNIEGKEYLWMVLVPTFLIKLVMEQEKVSYNDAELLFKHMAFPKRPNRDSLGLGEPW